MLTTSTTNEHNNRNMFLTRSFGSLGLMSNERKTCPSIVGGLQPEVGGLIRRFYSNYMHLFDWVSHQGFGPIWSR